MMGFDYMGNIGMFFQKIILRAKFRILQYSSALFCMIRFKNLTTADQETAYQVQADPKAKVVLLTLKLEIQEIWIPGNYYY